MTHPNLTSRVFSAEIVQQGPIRIRKERLLDIATCKSDPGFAEFMAEFGSKNS